MVVWNTFQNDARVLNEASTLARAGYHVRVVALHAPDVTVRSERLESNLDVRRVGSSQGRRLSRLSRSTAAAPGKAWRLIALVTTRAWTHLLLLWELLRARPAVVHAHDVNVLPTAWLAARFRGAALIYDAHEISVGREGYDAARGVVAGIERRLMPGAAATITTTAMRAKFFARAYGVARPLVLQNRPRLIAPERTELLRTELQLEHAWPIVLYQGGLQPGRGLEDLVRSASELPESYFVFIGGGRSESVLRVLASDLRLSDRVHFVPTVPLVRLPLYTASADIGVQPIRNTCVNHWTTDSNKLFEYAMAGLPVLASDFPEIRRIVSGFGLGEVFDPDRPGDLTRGLARMLVSEDLRRKYARNALQHRAALSWESQEPALLALYDELG